MYYSASPLLNTLSWFNDMVVLCHSSADAVAQPHHGFPCFLKSQGGQEVHVQSQDLMAVDADTPHVQAVAGLWLMQLTVNIVLVMAACTGRIAIKSPCMPVTQPHTKDSESQYVVHNISAR